MDSSINYLDDHPINPHRPPFELCFLKDVNYTKTQRTQINHNLYCHLAPPTHLRYQTKTTSGTNREPAINLEMFFPEFNFIKKSKYFTNPKRQPFNFLSYLGLFEVKHY